MSLDAIPIHVIDSPPPEAGLTGNAPPLLHELAEQVRRLLDYCGLPFEAACLDFHQNRRAVSTASSEQVRRPIFRSGLDYWRHYEPWLDPLKAELGGLLHNWARLAR